MATSPISGLGQQAQQASAVHDAWRQVSLDDFTRLLITELQNQDPLEPMNNAQILQQISQIREIESNQRLAETLESVLLGQSVATAGNLLERTIVGLSDDSQTVTGPVDRVSIEDGLVRLHLGEHTVALKNVTEILPDNADTA
jgi:flagellar basal-body rod modification protein FlgD